MKTILEINLLDRLRGEKKKLKEVLEKIIFDAKKWEKQS